MVLKIENFVKIVLHDTNCRDNHSIISDNQMFVGNSCVNGTCSPYDITLKRGIYSFECFGASGNDGNPSTTFSRGGITFGMIRIFETKRMFVYIGEKGEKNGPPTFNGGGKGNIYSFSGGGATDVRLSPGDWNNSESLESRIMVASGGGGFTKFGTNNHDGNNLSINSNGGGLIGNMGPRYIRNNPKLVITHAIGGSQDKGGLGGYDNATDYNYQNNKEINGSFGIGGSAFYGSGGGGGGYFGGGAGKTNANQVGAGAGGSSYISGYKGCHSVIKGSENFDTKPSEIHYSGISFFNSRMSNDDSSEYNNGHGKMIITVLSALSKRSKKSNMISFLLHFIFFFSD